MLSYRNPAGNKRVAHGAVTAGHIIAGVCFLGQVTSIAAHFAVAMWYRFGHYHIHIGKWLHHQQTEIQD